MVQPAVQLRDVIDSDLPILFEYEQDPEANYMAGFTPENPNDREAFMAHWAKIRSNPALILQTILFDNQVVGYLASFEQLGNPSVAYWIGKPYWGKGIATAALTEFLKQLPTRPLYARVVKDNIGSRRVLEKCGFVITGEDRGFANARQAEVEEYILTLT